MTRKKLRKKRATKKNKSSNINETESTDDENILSKKFEELLNGMQVIDPIIRLSPLDKLYTPQTFKAKHIYSGPDKTGETSSVSDSLSESPPSQSMLDYFAGLDTESR